MNDIFCKTCGQPTGKLKFISGEFYERPVDGTTYVMRIENNKTTVFGCIDCLGDFLKENACFISSWSLDRDEIKITFHNDITHPTKSPIKRIFSKIRTAFVPKSKRIDLKNLLWEKTYESKASTDSNQQENRDTNPNRELGKNITTRKADEPDPQRTDEREKPKISGEPVF